MKKTSSTVAIFLFCVALTGCGKTLSGTYEANRSNLLSSEKDNLTFTSGNKVELSIAGLLVEENYKIEDNKVKITNSAGVTQVFTIDDHGCLDGGTLFGKYCKK